MKEKMLDGLTAFASIEMIYEFTEMFNIISNPFANVNTEYFNKY